MSVQLTTRQINALRLLLEQRQFSADDVALLDYHTLRRTPGIGTKSVNIIREWLGMYGKDLMNCPCSLSQSLRQRRLEGRLTQAILLLQKHGYKIVSPTERNAVLGMIERR